MHGYNVLEVVIVTMVAAFIVFGILAIRLPKPLSLFIKTGVWSTAICTACFILLLTFVMVKPGTIKHECKNEETKEFIQYSGNIAYYASKKVCTEYYPKKVFVDDWYEVVE